MTMPKTGVVATRVETVPPAPPKPLLSDEAKQHPIVKLITSADARKYIEPFLPKGIDIERVAASVLLAVQNDKTGSLKKCTPQSLVLGVARIQQWGLELGVTAHLVPFKNKIKTRQDDGTFKEEWVHEATPLADYKGLAELMIGSGAVRHVETHVVYQGDEFSYRLGLDPKIDHVPCERAKRGPITYAYCILHLPFGRAVFDVMAAADIEEIRQTYSKQWKNGPLPAWYAKKTVVRQVAKLVPKNPRLALALAVMDQERAVEFDATPSAPQIEALRDEDEIVVQHPDDITDDHTPADDEEEPCPF